MKTIGRYEVLGRLGRGAMSTVYKGRAPLTGRLVAIKLLEPRDDIFKELVGEARLRELFVEEARIMGGLAHEHVAQILDCDEHQGEPFIVLEYYPHSLGSFIGEAYQIETLTRKVAADRVQAYLSQTLAGLSRLHFAGIIHRDIKPYNLMLTSEDRVKIIDFGLSRVPGEEERAIPGMQVGSPYYAAPEQAKTATTVDLRADLFSVGALAYRMLTGRLYSRAEKSLPVSQQIPSLDQGWDAWFALALGKDPGERFTSAQAMRLALEEIPVSPDKGCRERLVTAFAEARGAKPRREGKRVWYKDIRWELDLDELLRPNSYWPTSFTVENTQVVRELRTGLSWQRLGSGFTLDWYQAAAYVEQLNRQSWQGRADWRLPTLEELRSIVGPPLDGVACSTWPLFAPSLHWLWSADRCSKKQAWMVDLAGAYFARLDRDGAASGCAVSASPRTG